MRITLSKQAIKSLTRLDVTTKQRIKQAIRSIPQGDIKPLKGASGTYRLRVGNWRILFSYLVDEVYIRHIAPRGGVY